MTRLRIKAIVPAHIPTTEEYLKAILRAVHRTAGLVERDLESTTRTWNHKPHFRRVESKGKNLTITIGTDNLIYHFVDHGTKAHKITAKRSKYLRFSSGYRAKTRPNIIGSQDGGSFGDDQFAQSVNHPGFPGRKFIITIQKRRQVTLNQEVSHEIAKVNRTQK